jgi:hypothetical protein
LNAKGSNLGVFLLLDNLFIPLLHSRAAVMMILVILKQHRWTVYLLPSQRVDKNRIAHLSLVQQQELLTILDEFN